MQPGIYVKFVSFKLRFVVCGNPREYVGYNTIVLSYGIDQLIRNEISDIYEKFQVS